MICKDPSLNELALLVCQNIWWEMLNLDGSCHQVSGISLWEKLDNRVFLSKHIAKDQHWTCHWIWM